MLKVVLVDDHDLVRMGVARLLSDVKEFSIVGSFGSGEEVIEHCRVNSPDVILMDISMPGIGGLEATSKIKKMSDEIRILCLSMHIQNPLPTKVMQAGADGFISKSASHDEMVRAIYTVMSGQKYITPDIAQKIALSKIDEDSSTPFEVLSSREMEVVLMLTKGLKATEIAKSLNVSSKTVNTFRYRIFKKMSIKSDVELTHLALRHELI